MASPDEGRVTDDLRLDVDAEVDQEFEVALDARPGMGAIWYYAAATEEPELIRQNSEPQTTALGTIVRQRFVFRGTRPGRHELRFELKRSWERTVRRQAIASVSIGSRSTT